MELDSQPNFLESIDFLVLSNWSTCTLVSLHNTGWQKEEDGKIILFAKQDRAITCVFCHDPYLTVIMFAGLLLKDLFKRKV